jgi:hypothetical protein
MDEMRARRLVFVVLVPALAACALIADLGDRTLAAPDAGRDAAIIEPEEVPDGRAEPGVPGYCEGIILYASFDRALTGERGGKSVTPVGGAALTAEGRFQGGLSLVTDAAAPDEGAALFFLGGANWPAAAGSLSIWYRAVPGGAEAGVLYRPVASVPPARLQTSGLAFFLRLDIGDPTTGLVEQATTPVLMFPESDVAPFMRPKAFNHFFTAWRNDTAPTAFFALNGGTGQAFGDASGIDQPDAAVDGELRAPYRAFTSQPWTAGADPIALRLGGFGTNAPEGTVDDLAVWNRVLSFDEARAVFAADTPIGTACNIR